MTAEQAITLGVILVSIILVSFGIIDYRRYRKNKKFANEVDHE